MFHIILNQIIIVVLKSVSCYTDLHALSVWHERINVWGNYPK